MINTDKKNMKCGIITFHKAHNYGALLQAYALSYVLKRYVTDVKFIDYENSILTHGYNLLPVLKKGKITGYIKEWIHFFLDFKRKIKRHKSFSKFIEDNIECISTELPEKKLDIIFLGSDQIWNADYTGGIDSGYFGHVKNIKSSAVVSYAASMGKLSQSDKNKSEFLNLLKGIDFIGVRESYLKKYIESNTNLRCFLNLDPTLLLNKDDWAILSKKKKFEEKYLLIYEMHTHPETSKIASIIANTLGLNIKVLASRTNYKIDRNAITNADPCEFLTLFSNASFVLTTSFHGTVFSLINQIPFYTLSLGNEIDLRSSSLLDSVNLTCRLISSSTDIDLKELDVDFKYAAKKLDENRVESVTFIKHALGV